MKNIFTLNIIFPGVLTTIPVRIHHNAPSHVFVNVNGVGKINAQEDWVFANKSESIRVEKLGLNILVQTDRPLYKPGQTGEISNSFLTKIY